MKTDNKRLEKELATLREHLGKLFLKAHSRTINLDIETRGAVPGEAAFTLAAMAIHGFEPITYRYFDFNDDGSLHYLTDADIAKAEKAGQDGPRRPVRERRDPLQEDGRVARCASSGTSRTTSPTGT